MNNNIITTTAFIIILLLASCKTESKVSQLLESVDSSIAHEEMLEFKNTPIDSLGFVREPEIIHEIYDNYEDVEGLEHELRKKLGPRFKYMSRYTFCIMYHMHINDKEIGLLNFEIYSKLQNAAFEKSHEMDTKKICSYVFENMKNHKEGDYINFTLEVETDSEGTRTITYGSLGDKLYPKETYEDSVEIEGVLVRKGLYPNSKPKERDSLDCEGYIFELRLVAVSDTSVDRRLVGPSNKLLNGELFYLDLNSFGCRYL